MVTRRAFLHSLGAAGALGGAAAAQETPPDRRRRLAVVTTEWRERSHAWHMAERFLHGYPRGGQWHRPPFDVVGAYADPTPKNDLSRQRATGFRFTTYPTIAQAWRPGRGNVAV